MGKKLLAALAALFLLIPAARAVDTCAVPGLELEVPVPEGWYLLTRETVEGDPVLAEVGISKEDWDALAEAEGLYLDAVHPDGSWELLVTAQFDEAFEDLFDYGLLSTLEWNASIRAVKKEFEDLGFSVLSAEQSDVGAARYMLLSLREESTGTCSRQYSTIYNGQGFNFILRSYVGELPEEMEALLDETVAAAVFPAKETPPWESAGPDAPEAPEPAGKILTGAAWGAVIGAALAAAVAAAATLHKRRRRREE